MCFAELCREYIVGNLYAYGLGTWVRLIRSCHEFSKYRNWLNTEARLPFELPHEQAHHFVGLNRQDRGPRGSRPSVFLHDKLSYASCVVAILRLSNWLRSHDARTQLFPQPLREVRIDGLVANSQPFFSAEVKYGIDLGGFQFKEGEVHIFSQVRFHHLDGCSHTANLFSNREFQIGRR